jgi:hypothetical protein
MSPSTATPSSIPNPFSAMTRFQKARQRLAGDARQHAVLGLDDGDGHAALAHDGRGFEPDIATADYDHRLRRVQLGLEPVDVVAVADVVHALQIAPFTPQAARVAAGRPDEAVVLHDFAPREAQCVRARGNLLDPPSQQKVDPPVDPVLRRADVQALERALAAEVFLRERRALIRQVGLGADDGDRAVEPVLTQGDGAFGARVPRAHDDNSVMHQSVQRGDRDVKAIKIGREGYLAGQARLRPAMIGTVQQVILVLGHPVRGAGPVGINIDMAGGARHRAAATRHQFVEARVANDFHDRHARRGGDVMRLAVSGRDAKGAHGSSGLRAASAAALTADQMG